MLTIRLRSLATPRIFTRDTRFAASSVWWLVATVTLCQTVSRAADPGQPVVARQEMKLAGVGESVELIAQGDLLTVVEDRDDDYVIVTHQGTRGLVGKVNVAELAESTSIYTELIEKFPQEGRYDTLRASAWWARGEKDKALADFNSAIAKGYQASHAYSSRGLFLAAHGDPDAAIADYEKALAIDPADVTPRINRAELEMQQGDYEKAITDYTAALQIRQDNAVLLQQRATAYQAAGKLDQAIADLDAIISADDQAAEAVMDRGYIRFQQSQFAAAAKDFSIAIELNGKDPVAWNNRGFNRYQLGQSNEALQDYDHAIALSPRYALAHQNRAWLLATTDDPALRDPEAAIEAARKACDINSYESISDLSALAAAYASAGRFQDAIQWQEKVAEAAPTEVQTVAITLLERYRDEKPYLAVPAVKAVDSGDDTSTERQQLSTTDDAAPE